MSERPGVAESTLVREREHVGAPTDLDGGTLELAVVVPSFNERSNVSTLVERLDRALQGVRFEILFVDDDSTDGTAEEVFAIARRDRRVRCLQRIGRRGLSSACIEGMLATGAPFLAVIDADLQHDEGILPDMLALLREGRADLVVGSRYTSGTDVPDWDRTRVAISRLSTLLGRRVLRTGVSDPLSGFFMVRREVFHGSVRDLSGIGFKILLDLLASLPHDVRVEEVPYRFRPRAAGESKLDARAATDFGLLVIDKLVGGLVPARFVLFAMVGSAGVVVHMAALAVLFRVVDTTFIPAQTVATLVAMTFNFTINNELTFRDRRLTGWGWFRGLGSFALACSIGAVANVGIAGVLYRYDTHWVLSALGGILIGAVWNYTVTSFYTWKSRGPR